MKNLFRASLIVVAAAGLMSCNGVNGGGSQISMTPDENKARLEEVGQEVIAKFKPEVQENLIRAVNDFQIYANEGNLEVYDKYGASEFAAQFASVVKSTVEGANLGGIMALAAPNSHLYEAARIYGIYTYNGSSWSRTESTDKIEFRFTTEEGKSVVVTAQASEGGTELTIEGETIVIPQQVTAAVTIEGRTEFSANVRTSCNFGSTVTVDIAIDANGYVVKENVTVNPNSGSCSASFGIDGETIVAMNGTFTGNNLTNPDHIYDNSMTIGGSANAQVTIMNEVQVKGSCSDISAMVHELYNLEWDSSNIESARQEAAIYNKYITAGLTYDNATNFVATLEIAPYEYESSYTTDVWNPDTQQYEQKVITNYYYYTEPLIVFTSDGSRFSLEDYFTEENFGGLIESFENLYKIYAGYVGAVVE
jgi:hypothetical protein